MVDFRRGCPSLVEDVVIDRRTDSVTKLGRDVAAAFHVWIAIVCHNAVGVCIVVESPPGQSTRRIVHAIEARPHVVCDIEAPDVVRPRAGAFVLCMKRLIVDRCGGPNPIHRFDNVIRKARRRRVDVEKVRVSTVTLDKAAEVQIDESPPAAGWVYSNIADGRNIDVADEVVVAEKRDSGTAIANIMHTPAENDALVTAISHRVRVHHAMTGEISDVVVPKFEAGVGSRQLHNRTWTAATGTGVRAHRKSDDPDVALAAEEHAAGRDCTIRHQCDGIPSRAADRRRGCFDIHPGLHPHHIASRHMAGPVVDASPRTISRVCRPRICVIAIGADVERRSVNHCGKQDQHSECNSATV